MRNVNFIFICLALAAPCFAKTIYVDDDADGSNDGSSWANAYNLLQDGLDDAISGDEIWVASGMYKPTMLVDPCDLRTATFQLINGVRIYGGFPDTGDPNWDERDPSMYETILSGDLDGNDVQGLDPCDLLDEPTRSENSYHVLIGSRTVPNAVLDGFTITAGNADAYPHHCGGGMYNKLGSSPTVTNCTFSGNSAADNGGGIGNWYNSDPTVTNCTFSGNSAWNGGGIGNWYNSDPMVINCNFCSNTAGNTAGGMCNMNNCDPTVTNCIFSGNSADGSGGGMYNWESSNPTVINCSFSGNSADDYGGGMANGNSSPELTNCTFSGNSAENYGGGMYNYNSNPTITNSTFSSNSAHSGGGMCNFGSSPTVTNCTFNGNSADYRGGGICIDSHCNLSIINCILWDNTAPEESEIYIDDRSTANVSYSCILGGWSGLGNIDIDPCFADPCDGYYYLMSQAGRWEPNSESWVQDEVTSPCIDAGDPKSSIGWEPFPNGGRINMGAYGGTEQASKSYFEELVCTKPIAGDIDGDCKVDFYDFGIMAFHWLEDNRE